jgi:hypothetical protein
MIASVGPVPVPVRSKPALRWSGRGLGLGLASSNAQPCPASTPYAAHLFLKGAGGKMWRKVARDTVLYSEVRHIYSWSPIVIAQTRSLSSPPTWHLAPGTWHLAPGTWRVAMTLKHESCVVPQTNFIHSKSLSLVRPLTVNILVHDRCQWRETLNPI